MVTGTLAPLISGAQTPARLQGEIRSDAFVARDLTLHLGAGVNTRVASSVRLSLVAGAGRVFEDEKSRFSARAEVTGRFLLDPDMRARWGVYAGGGVGVRHERSDSPHLVLILALGAEGSRFGSLVPFVESGYGGGLRLSAGFRQARTGQR